MAAVADVFVCMTELAPIYIRDCYESIVHQISFVLAVSDTNSSATDCNNASHKSINSSMD
jgi:hypothetical protein